MNASSNGEEHNIGFLFRSRTPPTDETYLIFDVYIREEPTLDHFDPETLELSVWSRSASGSVPGTETLKVHHPWALKDHYRVVLGRVIVSDRVGKTVEAFTFGGDLSIHAEHGLTHCRLESEVPIFDLDRAGTRAELLVTEVEATLAEYRAQALDHASEFETELAGVDPVRLYTGSLVTLERRYRAFSHKELPEYQRLLRLVRVELKRFIEEGKCPPEPKSLAELLSVEQAGDSSVSHSRGI